MHLICFVSPSTGTILHNIMVSPVASKYSAVLREILNMTVTIKAKSTENAIWCSLEFEYWPGPIGFGAQKVQTHQISRSFYQAESLKSARIRKIAGHKIFGV